MFGQSRGVCVQCCIGSAMAALWAASHLAQAESGPLGETMWNVAISIVPCLGLLASFRFGPCRA